MGFAERTIFRHRGVAALVIVVSLLAASCSSSSEPVDVAATTAVETATQPVELASLGALAQSSGPAVTVAFDADAGEHELTDGTVLRVPAGAFPGPTDVTIELMDLAFGDYLDAVPNGTLYVVSTQQEVALGEPVVLVVDQPTDAVTVTQFNDGEWRAMSLPPAATTEVPIEHFSTVSTAVVKRFEAAAAAKSAASPTESDATYLASCIGAANRMLGGEIEDDVANPASDEELLTAAYATELALSVCTRALIDRATPEGQRVSTACVGSRIDDDTNFRQAIAECVADADGPDTSEQASAAEEAADAAPVGSDEPAVPEGPVTFSGSASKGAIANGPQDDLVSAEFTATVDGSTVVMDVTLIIHEWLRGGPEDVYVDQNCGVTYRHVLHLEGPAGNPTSIRATVDASEVLEVQGVLCDDDDDQRWLLDVGEMTGSFAGQANGLGIDGTVKVALRSIDLSSG